MREMQKQNHAYLFTQPCPIHINLRMVEFKERAGKMAPCTNFPCYTTDDGPASPVGYHVGRGKTTAPLSPAIRACPLYETASQAKGEEREIHVD
jgi:hypothetical protein